MRDHRDDVVPAPLLGWALCGLLAWLVVAGMVWGLVLASRAVRGLL